MSNSNVGTGGFFLPEIYTKHQKDIIECLKRGEIDYSDSSQWSFADEFLCFILQSKFLEFADASYPNPRKKNDIPIWFLIASQLVLRLHNRRSYHDLNYFLNAGSILTKVGFNTSRQGIVGFNDKNTYERKTAIHQDASRKFFKDIKPKMIREWYNVPFQRWMKAHKVYDTDGLFILDQSHLVVPSNENYKDAVPMPVDEHGQLYKNLGKMKDEERKKLIYHPCYALSCLLHVNHKGDLFHISGYELGPGNTDELDHAEMLVPSFCEHHPGVMKELIMDRGYISGPFIGKLKQTYNVDVLIPLKKNMSDFQDAFDIAGRKNRWATTQVEMDAQGHLTKETVTTHVEHMNLWEDCPIPLEVYVSKSKQWNTEKNAYDEYEWALAATKRYPSEKAAIERYGLRTQVEERFKQLKCYWNISKFTSPSEGLIEAHVSFILLTYSLLQLYLRRNELQELAHRTIETLRNEERLGKDMVIIYAGSHFGVLCLDDYSLILIDMDPEPKQKLKLTLTQQREVRAIRNSHKPIVR